MGQAGVNSCKLFSHDMVLPFARAHRLVGDGSPDCHVHRIRNFNFYHLSSGSKTKTTVRLPQ